VKYQTLGVCYITLHRPSIATPEILCSGAQTIYSTIRPIFKDEEPMRFIFSDFVIFALQVASTFLLQLMPQNDFESALMGHTHWDATFRLLDQNILKLWGVRTSHMKGFRSSGYLNLALFSHIIILFVLCAALNFRPGDVPPLPRTSFISTSDTQIH